MKAGISKPNPYTLMFGKLPNQFISRTTQYFKKQKEWIVVDLSSEDDMIQSLASHLSSDTTLARIFRSAKINLSFFGLDIEAKG